MLIDDVGSDNLGITLDFCHMIMKKENPAFSLFQSARKTASSVSIFNDGYGHFDDGLMLGSYISSRLWNISTTRNALVLVA